VEHSIAVVDPGLDQTTGQCLCQFHSQQVSNAFADDLDQSCHQRAFADACANARTYVQRCSDTDASLNAPANVSVCVHGNVLVGTSLLRCGRRTAGWNRIAAGCYAGA